MRSALSVLQDLRWLRLVQIEIFLPYSAEKCFSAINVNTIRNMEARGADILDSGLDTVSKVQGALEAAGIVFIPENGGGAGVRQKK